MSCVHRCRLMKRRPTCPRARIFMVKPVFEVDGRRLKSHLRGAVRRVSPSGDTGHVVTAVTSVAELRNSW
jgi:hypothetical protein